MSSSDKKKVALVFTGAVSLGSFEAGVAYELVKYIQEQNRPELEVDVIVGTSAGALTGALTALALIYGLDPSIIEKAWLSVGLEDLLRLNPGDKSVLSSSKVEALIARYINSGLAKLGSRPKSIREINLAVVVTNLDGIKYQIHRAANPDFNISAIGYEDAIKFRIRPGFDEWERLGEAVRASSAFPIAFEPKKILREDREFLRTAKYNFPENPRRYFNYSDGGIVNNQPLNKAIEIVNDLPFNNNNNGSHERIFLVVDPAPPLDLVNIKDYGAFDVFSKAVWTIPRNQTLFKDILFLEKINRRIRWKNEFVSSLADIWNSTKINKHTEDSLDSLYREIASFKGKAMLGIDTDRYLKYERERIMASYKSEMLKVGDKESFIKYCFLLEHVADLRNKQEVSVQMISPQEPVSELAGEIYGNFGGFLDSGFIKHDYTVGRTYAQRWLNKSNELNRLIKFEQEDISPGVRFRVLSKIIDNSIPLLIEDITPRMFFGNGALKPNIGIFALVGLVSKSIIKYVINKGFSLAKQMFLPPNLK